MAMVDMREGDWTCASCSNHNFASRAVCNRCQGPKSPPAGGHVREGDWMCPSCANHNFASRSACNKCRAPRPGAASGPPGAGGGKGFNPRDWICAACSNHNFASREQCNRCSGPRTGSVGAANFGPCKGAPGGVGGRPAPYAAPPGAGPRPMGNMRPGDWICQTCANHNFASRDTCNKCTRDKPIAELATAPDFSGQAAPPSFGGQAVPPSFGGQAAPPSFGGQAVPPSFGGQAMPPNFRAGDWICPSCNNHNFASKTACNKCARDKPIAELATAPDFSGQAAPPSFGGQAAPPSFGGQAMPPNFRPGDWICSSCKNHNFASKTACNKCQEPKETEAFT